MIEYNGYGRVKEKPPEPKVTGSEYFNKRIPYEFHFEDWTGEEVYNQLFPLNTPMKRFALHLFIVSALLILMRIFIGLI